MYSDIESFERGQVDSFHHRDHLRTAWSYLRAYGFDDGSRRFIDALRRFGALNGKPNLYHATITWAYLVTINDRIERNGAGEWEPFAAENEDLFGWKPSILDGWYRPETLASDHARRVFVMPDYCVPLAKS